MPSPYDNKNYTGQDLSNRRDMDGLVIEGLCLSQEIPNSRVLPPQLTGVTFSYCNLDNVFIPPGNVAKNCSTRTFKVQNDGEDWHVDPQSLLPIAPLNLEDYLFLKLDPSPAALPNRPSDTSLLFQAKMALLAGEQDVGEQAKAAAIADYDAANTGGK